MPNDDFTKLRSARALIGWGGCIGLLVQFAVAAAQTTEAVRPVPPCTLNEYPPVMTTQISESMSWFSKPLPEQDWIAYIGGTNRLVRQDQPSMRLSIPGGIDPVPTPDGRYITIPVGRMSWYRTNDLFQTGLNSATRDARSVPAAYEETDSNLSGVYQSVGVLPGATPFDTTYRLITESPSGDRSQLRMKTLRVTQADAGSPEIFRSVGPIVSLCPGIRVKTPIISKDGLEMSAYVSDTGTTKIFRIGDDGSCTEVVNLGIPTGKLDFSFDGNRVAFHMDQYDSNDDGDWFSGVSSAVTKNIFVAELDRSVTPVRVARIIPITNHKTKGDGSYYPGFRRDGKLIYMTSKAITGGRGYSFSLVDIDGSTTTQPYPGGPSGLKGDEALPKAALGALWMSVCSGYGTSTLRTNDAVLFSLGLDPEGCRRLVERSWDSNRAAIVTILTSARLGSETRPADSLTKDDLLAACPTARPVPRQTRVYGEATPSRRTDPKEIFDANCRDCHMAQSPNGYINIDRLTLYHLDEMIYRLGRTRGDPDRMPPADMDSDERIILQNYVQRLRDQFIRDANMLDAKEAEAE